MIDVIRSARAAPHSVGMRIPSWTLLLGASLALLACTEDKPSGANKPVPAVKPTTTAAATATATAAAAGDAKSVFAMRCAACHGESGKGDGPGAAALNPKPRDYTNTEWQASVTDEQLKKTILYGGAAVGKSPAMPASTDLDGKPELDLLVQYIRSFKGK